MWQVSRFLDMREIKFRAWDRDEKKWTHYFNIGPLGTVVDLAGDEYLNCELMQYTGLKDKNGTEIYEGDVVRMDAGTDEAAICTVSWLDDGFVLIGDGYNAEHLYPQIRDGRFGEVIGNLYENPELLR